MQVFCATGEIDSDRLAAIFTPFGGALRASKTLARFFRTEVLISFRACHIQKRVPSEPFSVLPDM